MPILVLSPEIQRSGRSTPKMLTRWLRSSENETGPGSGVENPSLAWTPRAAPISAASAEAATTRAKSVRLDGPPISVRCPSPRRSSKTRFTLPGGIPRATAEKLSRSIRPQERNGGGSGREIGPSATWHSPAVPIRQRSSTESSTWGRRPTRSTHSANDRIISGVSSTRTVHHSAPDGTELFEPPMAPSPIREPTTPRPDRTRRSSHSIGSPILPRLE